MRKKILYIGNKLSNSGATVTSIETLGGFLEDENYTLRYASHYKNKYVRMLHMLACVCWYGSQVHYVLIDTYSTQNYWYAVAVGRLCKILKIKYIPILRGGNLPMRIHKNPITAQYLFKYSYVNIVPSSYMKNQLEKEKIKQIRHIPNTIDITKYDFLIRKTIKPQLLWVRSFAEVYNPLLALKIVKKLAVKFPDIALCMVGPDKDGSLEKCKVFAKANQLNVVFTGKLEKKAWVKLAQSYDIFINTTHVDNTPVSVIEAMALGLPVVSTDVGGIPFLIQHNDNGILVSDDDLDGFTHQIEQLLEGKVATYDIIKNAREQAEQFDWKNIRKQWIELLS